MSSANPDHLPCQVTHQTSPAEKEVFREIYELIQSGVTCALRARANRRGQLKRDVSIYLHFGERNEFFIGVCFTASKGETVQVATHRILRSMANGSIKFEETPRNEPAYWEDTYSDRVLPTPRIGELIICLFTPLNRQRDRLADHVELFTTEWVPRFGVRVAGWVYIWKALESAAAMVRIAVVAAIADWFARVWRD
jgi:hypothetical protein